MKCADTNSNAAPAPHIRPAEPEEYDEVGEFTHEQFKISLPELPVTPASESRDRDVSGRMAQGVVLIARDRLSRELLGTASVLRFGRAHARLPKPGEAEIRLVAVAPHSRGRGIGQLLVRECIRAARQWNVTAIVLDTAPNNVVAQRLYLRNGFVPAPELETLVVPNIGRITCFRKVLEGADAQESRQFQGR